MEWWLVLILIVSTLLVIMTLGLPVAFSFMLVNIIGVYLFFGGEAGLKHLILSFHSGITTFTLMPVPLFILMGEVMFASGIAPNMIDALDKWLGRLPGRLGLLAVGGGTLFSTLTGASMASVAMLGSTLVPEMEKRGYKNQMTLGPILGSGGLAIMIPPSGLAVLLGAIGELSVGKILVAIMIPGLLMAVLYSAYIIGRCTLQPSIAPAYAIDPPPLSDKVMSTIKYILPMGFIIFLVVGIIFIGVATPSEAAATGTIGTFILIACYRKLNWNVVKISIISTLELTVMMFMIIVGAKAFAEILAVTGATRGLAQITVGLPIAPILIIVAMQIVVLVLGMFMSVVGIMMITLPIFVPVVITLGFDPIWFAVMFLLNIEMATTTPPYGMSLFVMKGVAPPGTTMGDIYRAALPFLYCDLIAMALILAVPSLALWLPELMS